MQWIPVVEALPPLHVKFDVWDDYHKCRLADHGAYEGPWDDDFRRDTLLIHGYTHWMIVVPPVASNNNFNLTTVGPCTRPDMVDCHAKAGTGGICMNGFRCPPLQVKQIL